MNNGNTQDDFDSIAQLLRAQNAVLEVLVHHLAHVEATLFALAIKALSNDKFIAAKHLKDHLQPTFYADMMAQAERNLAES
jgi:hypothetical protein